MKVSLLHLVLACLLLISWTATQAQAQVLDGKPHQRDDWYIGFGAGTGFGAYTVNGEELDLHEVGKPAVDPNLYTLNFKAGATLSPNFLVGVDFSTARVFGSEESQATGLDLSVGVDMLSMNAVVTWFPLQEGIFLRAGAGASSITVNVDVGQIRYEESTSGLGALVGAGFAFWLGEAFNFTLNIDAHFHRYSGDELQPESGNYINLYAGFGWY